ncbi:MAG: NUDIX hydrolase [Bdellovibrionota bacterium]
MSKRPLWTRLDDRLLQKTRVFDLRAQRMRSGDGSYEDDFFYIETPDWVNVIAITPDQQVVLVRQYRHGINEFSLETPGGMVDKEAEDHRDTAMRELSEETGYSSNNVTFLGSIRPNPAMLTNHCHVYLAADATLASGQNLDPSEDITVELAPLADIPEMIRSGKIVHSIVSAAFFLLWIQKPELRVG